MHVLVIGAWPELSANLIGLPARVSLLQLPELGTEHEAAWVHRYELLDYRDAEVVLAWAKRLHSVDPINVVVGLRQYALPAVAAVAGALELRCLPGPAHTVVGDKTAARQRMNDGGCLPVSYAVCDDPADIVRFATEIGYPVIAKPMAGTGSEGVHVVRSADDAATAWQHAVGASGGPPVLVERFLAGPEYSVETRSVDGGHEVITITEKITTGEPYRVETGHVMPARINAAAAASLGDEAIRGLMAVGHLLGPSHVELILTEEGPTIVEINRRIGGDRIWELIMITTGRNLMREALLDAIGPPATPSGRSTTIGAAIRFITMPAGRRLIEPVPAFTPCTVPGVMRTQVSVPASRDPLRPPKSSSERLGYVLAMAPTAAAADAAAKAGHDHVVEELFATGGRHQ